MRKAVIKGALILAIVVAAWQFGQAQAPLADFKLTVEPSASGASFKCSKGCAWTTLAFKCDGKQPCTAQVDQTGVGTIGGK
jgi:hypothetical protein